MIWTAMIASQMWINRLFSPMCSKTFRPSERTLNALTMKLKTNIQKKPVYHWASVAKHERKTGTRNHARLMMVSQMLIIKI